MVIDTLALALLLPFIAFVMLLSGRGIFHPIVRGSKGQRGMDEGLPTKGISRFNWVCRASQSGSKIEPGLSQLGGSGGH